MLVKDSIEEEDSIHKFEVSVHDASRGTINENQEQFSEDVEESHRVDKKRSEGKSSLEFPVTDNKMIMEFTGVQEDIMEFPVTNNLKMIIHRVQMKNLKKSHLQHD